MIFKPHRIEWKLKPNINLKVQLKIKDNSNLNADNIKEINNQSLILENSVGQDFQESNKNLGASVDCNTNTQSVKDIPCDIVYSDSAVKNTDEDSHLDLSYGHNIVVDGNKVNPNLAQYIKEDPAVLRDSEYENLVGNYSYWHLRKKRADIFLSKNSQFEFIPSLLDFLNKKKVTVLPFDDKVHYLPSDILLLSDEDRVEQGTVFYLSQGKKALWQFLKCELAGKVL